MIIGFLHNDSEDFYSNQLKDERMILIKGIICKKILSKALETVMLSGVANQWHEWPDLMCSGSHVT